MTREQINARGQVFAELRQERYLTRDEVAERLGVSRQIVTDLETGDYRPSLRMEFELLAVLETSLLGLWERMEALCPSGVTPTWPERLRAQLESVRR